MNYNFYFILLLSCAICYGDDNKIEKSDNFKINEYSEKGNPFQDPYNYERDGYDGQKDSDRYIDYGDFDKYDEEYVGNPDFDAKIERPCRVFDLNCIRKYFAEHSMCKIRRGPLPRNLYITQETFYFSRINVTVIMNNFEVGGIRSTRIEEFYVNKQTNRMVFAINIRNKFSFLPTLYFQFYRNASEPIVLVTESAILYPSVTFTAVIPNIDNLELRNSEMTAFVDAVPPFYLGPELLNSTDPTVIQALGEFFIDLNTNTQELMLTASQLFASTYIQYNICDFGLKVFPAVNDDNIFTIQDPTVIQTFVEFLADVPTDTQELMLTESQFYPPAYIQYNICDFGYKVLPVDNTDNIFTIQG